MAEHTTDIYRDGERNRVRMPVWSSIRNKETHA
jgi:hypothetical protein